MIKREPVARGPEEIEMLPVRNMSPVTIQYAALFAAILEITFLLDLKKGTNSIDTSRSNTTVSKIPSNTNRSA